MVTSLVWELVTVSTWREAASEEEAAATEAARIAAETKYFIAIDGSWFVVVGV